MQSRLEYAQVEPAALKALLGLESYVNASGLEETLLDLVRIRASQINGCAFCLDMHTLDARAGGETEQRIYALDAWREAPFYSERERAALLLTESVTLIAADHVPDDVYAVVSAHFAPEEIVRLTMAIVTINAWNRMAITFRRMAGRYHSTRKPPRAA